MKFENLNEFHYDQKSTICEIVANTWVNHTNVNEDSLKDAYGSNIANKMKSGMEIMITIKPAQLNIWKAL